MENFKKLQKMQKKLKRHYISETILIILLFIIAIVGCLAGFEVIHIKEDVLWIALIVIMVPVFLLTGVINFFRERCINYFKLYKEIFLTKAILYSQDAVMNCANNSFAERQRLNDTGLVYFPAEDARYRSDRFENTLFFSGDYKDSHIEGTHILSYVVNLEYRRDRAFTSVADKLETRVDRSKNTVVRFYTIGEADNITYPGIHPVMIYHKNFVDKKLFKKEKFQVFPNMTTGNSLFDDLYEIKTIDPDKAKSLFTEDVISAMIDIGNNGKPMGLHFVEGKVVFAIEERMTGVRKEAFKQLDYDSEYAKSSKQVEMYMKLLKALKGERI